MCNLKVDYRFSRGNGLTAKPTLVEIENAFQPAQEVTAADRFAGRSEAVREAYLALLSKGSNLAIVGNRGIGKTSLARQVENLGGGDNTLLQRLELGSEHKNDFLTIYYACGSEIENVNDLLRTLLTNRDCLAEWIYEIPRAKEILNSMAPKLGAKFFGFNAEVGGENSDRETSESVMPVHSLETIFTNVAGEVASSKIARDGILIIVDEFDQITDTSGFDNLLQVL